MIWREPRAETEEYPGLVVHDGRVSGSITAGRSRLPLWALTYGIPHGWDTVEHGHEPSEYGLTGEHFGLFIHDLMQLRGEFGRLLCVLADAERCDREKGRMDTAWWETKRHRKRVGDQLRRCLDALESEGTP